jgi:hypothetical protein
MRDDIKAILDKPTCTVEQVRKIVPGSKNATYEAIKRGDIPSIRVGNRIHVLTTPLKAKLGLGQ